MNKKVIWSILILLLITGLGIAIYRDRPEKFQHIITLKQDGSGEPWLSTSSNSLLVNEGAILASSPASEDQIKEKYSPNSFIYGGGTLWIFVDETTLKIGHPLCNLAELPAHTIITRHDIDFVQNGKAFYLFKPITRFTLEKENEAYTLTID